MTNSCMRPMSPLTDATLSSSLSLQSSCATPKRLDFASKAVAVPQNEENTANGIGQIFRRPKMGDSQRSFGNLSMASSTISDANRTANQPVPSDILVHDDTSTTLEFATLQSTASSSDVGSTAGSEASVTRLRGWLDDFGKQNRTHYEQQHSIPKSSSTDSDCESDVSVARLKGWLDDFGKQNQKHYSKMTTIGKAPEGVALAKPIRPKCTASATPIVHRSKVASSAPMTASATTARHTTTTNTSDASSSSSSTSTRESTKGPAKTPIRFKPRFRSEDVQATNDGYASVKKLSAWLADGPCSDKRVCHVRRGMNVIAKSRVFEKELANVVVEENVIVKGSVSDKKKWLKSAFGEDDKAEGSDETGLVNVTDKKKWLQQAFQPDEVVASCNGKQAKKNGEDVETTEEKFQVAQNTTPSMSVMDKKKWLQNAFKKEEEKRGEALAPVEMRASKVAVKAARVVEDFSVNVSVGDARTERTVDVSGEKSADDEISTDISVVNVDKSVGVVSNKSYPDSNVLTDDDRTLLPTTSTNKPDATLTEPQAEHKEKDEEESHVDFKAARQLLLQRSAQNGNPVKVLTKVDRKKQKFERIQLENQRKSAAHGLLKASWQQGDSSGGPSRRYSKTFVSDIAPKKSFEELP